VQKVADDLWLLDGMPPFAVNIFLAGDTLIDAGTRFAEKRIVRQVSKLDLAAHALTHAHSDHQGSTHAICERFEIPLMCGEEEADFVESVGLAPAPPGKWSNFTKKNWAGPPHPVDRRLKEGDEVAGFKVIDVPGHSPGHIAFFRESDRVLILGDVVTNMDLRTGIPGLHEPPSFATLDPALNRDSARKLAALEPELVCSGHGRPLADPSRFAKFVESLD